MDSCENTYTVGGTPLYDWTVTRDNAGRITQKIDNMKGVGIVWAYTYDTLGRLTEVKQNNSIVESYTYDADSNRLIETNTLRGISNKSYSYSLDDHVLTAGADSYQFDKDGFLTSKITSAGTTTYNYSSRGELLSATLTDGTVISYDHDPMGRRIAKRVNGTITEKYLWQGLTRLLAVYDVNNNLVMRFTYADGRLPVSMTKSGSTYYLAYDQIGSLRAVIDSAESVIKEVLYDSFGVIIYDNNPAFTVPFGFAGGMHDRDTGLVRFGLRDYDPAIGRWTAKDPIDFVGGDLNLFGYVGNNPVNRIDPLGLQGSSTLPDTIMNPFDPNTWNYIFTNLGDSISQPNGSLTNDYTQQDGVCSLGPLGPLANACILPKCQTHDVCYTENKCNASSWWSSLLGGAKSCNKCNSDFF